MPLDFRLIGLYCLIPIGLFFHTKDVHSANKLKLCTEIRKIALEGQIKKLSVPFSEDADVMIYRFDMDKNGKTDSLKAACGYSSDAECEMVLEINKKMQRIFYTLNGFRFVEYKSNFYLIWGVIHGLNNRVDIHKLRIEHVAPANNIQICN